MVRANQFAQFALRNQSCDDTRYFHVVAALDSQKATRALSVIASPPLTNKYEALKSFLCSAFGLSETERANTLLDLGGLGDRKPSELMDSMLALLKDHKPCFIFKQIIFRQLPEKVRVPLANSPKTDLRILSLEADRILASLSPECNLSESAEVSTVCWFHRRFGRKHNAVTAPANTIQVLHIITGRETPKRNIGPFQLQRTTNMRSFGSSQQMSAARSLALIFLRTHNLLVDMRNHRLIEADTFSGIPCYVSTVTPTNLALVEPSSNKFRKLLKEFPDLLKPTFSTAEVKHGVHHFIPTKDRPVFARARRFAPDRLAIAKKEFF